MSASGVIINPQSGRGNGKGLALAAELTRQATTSVVLLDDFSRLEPGLASFAERGVTDLFISSGDGTIQAVQTLIAEGRAFKKPPRLCLLPHGTTNMTAADLGFRRKSVSDQAAFIGDPIPRTLKERPTMRIVNPLDGRPRHGMFVGTGAAAEATRYCQRVFNDRGVKGNLATFATLASAVGKTVFSNPSPDDPNRFDRPHAITVRGPFGLLCTGMQLMAFATTLEKLILGTRPFWGGKTGPIRATSFPYPVPSVMRWLLPSIYGGEARRPPPGAKSIASDWLTIEAATDFVVDGEFFAAKPGEPLRIETGPLFTYITA